MKIVAIAGSPRKKGNSTALMRLAMEGAVERGTTAEVFSAKEMNVAGCLARRSCKRAPMRSACRRTTCTPCTRRSRRRCAAAGEPRLLLRAHLADQAGRRPLLRADALRGRAEGEQPVPRIAPGKRLYVITTQADDPCSTAYQVLSTIAYGMTWLGMKPAGQLVATSLQDADDWKARDDLIAAARALIAV